MSFATILKGPLTQCNLETPKRVTGKQCRPRSDAAELGIRSGSLMFANSFFLFFFCVEVLRPSQPNGVMSSAVSLPNYMFTGQA